MHERLGWTYRDTVTGFQGICTGWCTYISGCNQLLLVPPVDKEGKLVEAHWYDEQRCEKVDAERMVIGNLVDHPGPDKPAPIK